MNAIATRPPIVDVKAIMVTSVARHEADSMPSFVSETDISGRYERIRPRTLYCESASRYLYLNADGMAKVLAGEAIRVPSSAVD